MENLNVISCLFRQVLPPIELHCPIRELGQLKTLLPLCRNGRREGYWEGELLGMFTLDLIGNRDVSCLLVVASK